jgi:cytochrome c oxidase subunit IV
MNQAVIETPADASAHSKADAHAHGADHSPGQQHPIKIYLWIWLLLFVLSA